MRNEERAAIRAGMANQTEGEETVLSLPRQRSTTSNSAVFSPVTA